VAGGILLFSPSLPLATGSNKAALWGTITDGRTHQPLAGVTVSVSGGTTASIQTNSAGAYYLQPLNVGSLLIQASLAGYDSIRVNTTVSDGAQLRFSPALFPTGTTPPGANQSRVTGQVIDAVTRLPLAGVTLRAMSDNLTRSFKTDANGRFSVTLNTGSEIALDFTHPGYLPSQFSLVLAPPLTHQDLGQVPLRPVGLDAPLPDLDAVAVDARTVINDPQTLALSGSLDVTIKNRGVVTAPAGFQVLAFTDDNHDGRFNAVEDTALGETTVAAALAAGATTTVNLPLAGQAAFRDAPILVWVDSAQTVVESSEDNNIAASNGQCRLAPPVNGNFQPTLKWQWTQEKVMTIPLVAALNDTNGDHKIDTRDDPRVIFASFNGSVEFAAATLRAVDGKTGSLLWSVTDPALRVRASAHPAIGDIDGDGLPEIVAYRIGDGLVAITHTGALKWKTSYPLNPSNNYNQGGISLADLDGDGKAEILARGHVLNSDGSLRWTAAEPWNATSAIAVDLDNDGLQEVLIGSRAYRADGTLLWKADVGEEAFYAIGAFDAYQTPQIVYVQGGRVILRDRLGGMIWAVNLPGGGRGGPPTVADLDGDGWPEIGVAGRTSYTVFNRFGDILWSKPIQDFSSAVTGSTVFDFNGDGRAEVVYGDETTLRVYDGPTGNVIFSIPNGSRTATEYPVVADVDHDGHADLLVVGDLLPGGLRVFKDLNNAWVATRPLWNQYAYHIDNILDDLTVPRREVPSWLTHNSYRLNAFPDRHALDTVDLTTARLRLIDGGVNGLSLEARIGNAGPLALTSPATVAFYQGDPAAGGARLGAVALAALGAGQFQDVRLDPVTLSGSADVFAVVDPENAIAECREDNNRVSTSVASAAARGALAVATDAPSYGADRPVELRATVTNPGRLAHAYTVELRIEDRAGVLVIAFPALPVASLAGGASAVVLQPWNTGATLAGDYVLHGQLRDPAGETVAEARADFQITAADGLAAILRVATDRPDYGPDDRVGLAALAWNRSANRRIEDATVTLAVRGPTGAVVFTQHQALGSLPRQGWAEATASQRLRNASPGDYAVDGVLRDGQGVAWARASAAYRVVSSGGLSGLPLTGETTVAQAELKAGAAQSRDDTVRHTGATAWTGLRIARVLAREADGVEVARQEEVITLAANAEQRWRQDPIATAALTPGVYVAVLLAHIDGNWRALSFASFRVSDTPGGPGGPGGSSPAAIPTLGGPALLGLIALLLAAGRRRRSRRLPAFSSTSIDKG
jgi:hypothetical protein